jgi:hypothetical protein
MAAHSCARFSSMKRRQMASTLARYTRASSLRYGAARQRNGREGVSRITCTCAFTTRRPAVMKPSLILFSSMNFFQPQSCSFLQNRCSVSAKRASMAL